MHDITRASKSVIITNAVIGRWILYAKRSIKYINNLPSFKDLSPL